MNATALDLEIARLGALRRYGVLDTPPDPELDDVTRLAARLCGAPIAVVGFVDADRVFFKSRIGVERGEVPRDPSFSDQVILRGAFVAVDAASDERFRRNPLVCEPPYVRFAAGAPLLTPDGFALGALLVFDTASRQLADAQLEGLAILSRQVVGLLELRRLRLARASEPLVWSRAEAAPPALEKARKPALDAVITVDARGRVREFSRETVRMLGPPGEALLGASFEELVATPSDRERCRSELEAALGAGREDALGPFPVTVRRLDGSVFAAEATIVPRLRGAGEREAAIHLRDISGRSRLFDTLRNSVLGEEGKGLVSAAIPYPAEVCEAAMRSLYVLPEVDHCALFLLDAGRREARLAFWYGYEEEARRFPSVRLDQRSIIAHVMRTGARHLSPNVEEDPHYLRVSPQIRAELTFPLIVGGEVVGALDLESAQPNAFSPGLVSLCESVASGVAAALEGTNLTEQVLRAKLALEMTFDALPELVAILDDRGRIRRLNATMARRLGRPPRRLIGESLEELLPFCRDWLADTNRAALHGQSVWKELRDAQAGVVYEASLLPLVTRSALLGDRVVLLRDVSQERTMAQQVIAFERRAAIGDMMAAVAHDVRNPLAAIQAASEVLASEASRHLDLAPAVGIIGRQVERLNVLMRDLLELGKPAQELRLARDSLARVAREAIELWRENPARRERCVRVGSPPDEQVLVDLERSRIEQLVFNLLDNAAAHSPADSVIEVTLARSADRVTLRVTDRGTGVAPEVVPRVFEPFFTTRTGGVGLGLALVKNIAESHRGSVSAWNNDPPPGFSVELSLRAPEVKG